MHGEEQEEAITDVTEIQERNDGKKRLGRPSGSGRKVVGVVKGRRTGVSTRKRKHLL